MGYTKRSVCFSNLIGEPFLFFKLVMSEVLDRQKNDNSSEFPHTPQPVPSLITSYIYMLYLLQLVRHC